RVMSLLPEIPKKPAESSVKIKLLCLAIPPLSVTASVPIVVLAAAFVEIVRLSILIAIGCSARVDNHPCNGLPANCQYSDCEITMSGTSPHLVCCWSCRQPDQSNGTLSVAELARLPVISIPPQSVSHGL